MNILRPGCSKIAFTEFEWRYASQPTRIINCEGGAVQFEREYLSNYANWQNVGILVGNADFKIEEDLELFATAVWVKTGIPLRYAVWIEGESEDISPSEKEKLIEWVSKGVRVVKDDLGLFQTDPLLSDDEISKKDGAAQYVGEVKPEIGEKIWKSQKSHELRPLLKRVFKSFTTLWRRSWYKKSSNTLVYDASLLSAMTMGKYDASDLDWLAKNEDNRVFQWAVRTKMVPEEKIRRWEGYEECQSMMECIEDALMIWDELLTMALADEWHGYVLPFELQDGRSVSVEQWSQTKREMLTCIIADYGAESYFEALDIGVPVEDILG